MSSQLLTQRPNPLGEQTHGVLLFCIDVVSNALRHPFRKDRQVSCIAHIARPRAHIQETQTSVEQCGFREKHRVSPFNVRLRPQEVFVSAAQT